MLKQRVLTALVLLALLLPALLSASAWPFLIFVAIAMAAAGWEWGRLSGAPQWLAAVFGSLVLAGVVAGHYLISAPPPVFWILVLAAWVLGAALMLRRGAAGWAGSPRWTRLLLGLPVLIPAGMAMLDWKQQGLNALLSVLCLVWAADIAAYFGGRRFGRRKLAPAISPGKSWEGVWSGLLGVLLLAVFWVFCIDNQSWADSRSVYGSLVAGLGWPLALLGLILLAALSVVGDLIESLIKRAAGAKDSSRLLPGHGGVLDRVDALLPVLPAALGLLQLAKGLIG